MKTLATAALSLMFIATATAREVFVSADNFGGTLTIIDAKTLKVLGTFDVKPDFETRTRELGLRWIINKAIEAEGEIPFADDVKFSPDGRIAYISRGALADVTAFELATGKILWTAPIKGLRANHMNLTADGKTIYISAIQKRRVHIINARDGSERCKPIRTGRWPHGVEFSTDRHQNFVGIGEMKGGHLVIVDRRDNHGCGATPRFIDFGTGVRPFEFTEDGHRVFTQLSDFHGYVEYDLRSGARREYDIPENDHSRATYPRRYTRDAPHHGLRLSADGRYLALAATSNNEVWIVNTRNHSDRTKIDLGLEGSEPSWITNSLDGTRCYVSCRGSDALYVISYAQRRILKRIEVGDYPQRMATARVSKIHGVF